MDLNGIVNKLYKHSEVMELNNAATADEIRDFQRKNNIVLPPSYIEILKRFDGGELYVPGTLIFGLSKNNGIKSIKEINGKDLRRNFKIPPSMLIIGKLNFGDWICIELNGNNEIVQWDHENDEEYCRWNSLEEWIAETLSEYEEYEGGAQ